MCDSLKEGDIENHLDARDTLKMVKCSTIEIERNAPTGIRTRLLECLQNTIGVSNGSPRY